MVFSSHFFMDFLNKNKKILPFCILTFFVVAVVSFLFLNTHHAFAANFGYSNDSSNLAGAPIMENVSGAKLAAIAVKTLTSPFLWVFNILLYAVWVFCALLLYIAGMLMDWAVNPANFSLVAGNGALYEFWKIVRDFLNLAFILVLLYSAFCTIFQVEKYHLKKILLTLVIMALLVNFSFPIARFIIDTSNVLMYYILGTSFPSLSSSSGLSANLADMTSIVQIVSPDFGKGVLGNVSGFIFDASDTTIRLVVAIFFTSLVAITLLVIAALLVIRIVVLAILIVFSPIGFVGIILPSAKSFADSWWDQLFKQSFFGPIMVFMLALSLKMMQTMSLKSEIENSIRQLVNQNDALKNATYSQLIVTGTYLAIPVVILWIGLIAAQKLGAYGADAVIKKSKGSFIWAARYPGKALGIEGGAKKVYEHYKKKGVRVPFTNTRLFSDEKKEEREAKISGFFKEAEGITPKGIKKGFEGWKGARSNIEHKRAGERADELKKLNTSASDAKNNIDAAINRGDKVEAMGNAIYMMEKGLVTDAARLEVVLKATGTDEDLQAKIIDKLPKNLTKNIVTNIADLDTVLGVASTSKIKEAIKDKIKEDKNRRLLIDYDVSKGKPMDRALGDYLDNISGEELGRQKFLHDDAYITAKPDVHAYLYNKNKAFKQKAMEYMSDNAIETWTKKGIV